MAVFSTLKERAFQIHEAEIYRVIGLLATTRGMQIYQTEFTTRTNSGKPANIIGETQPKAMENAPKYLTRNGKYLRRDVLQNPPPLRRILTRLEQDTLDLLSLS